MLLVVDASRRSVRAVPVTLDVDAADDSAAMLSAESSDLACSLVVWLADATLLPLRVMDRYLGSLTVNLGELNAADRGRPVLTAADDRAVQRARRQDILDTFVAARWAPEGSGNLKELLPSSDVKGLAQVLQVPERTVVALRRGRAALTSEQAERLAPVVHLPVERLLAANPPLPEDLVADLDQPGYRAKVVALAERRGIDEIEAWLTAGFAVAAVAHRQTEGEKPAWTDRLDHYFALVLDEP
ncbi:hypothetical protein JKP75_13295 [Blastococcus sp. TML/M2B]|uniref:hypothetical protein n=1 Tax=Blastococcus sp. TML/M2B TaxID=2798727 RepID=UPI00190E1052|nr:hypothetical protein [Blastococcus sp. TML/M2B]MBN1093453.1 hypothetical protein [Blastococcus sp. TML/M2B]